MYVLVEMLDDTLEEIEVRGRQAVHDTTNAGNFGIKVRSIKGWCERVQHSRWYKRVPVLTDCP